MNYTDTINKCIEEAEERFNDLMKKEYPDLYKAGYKFYTNELYKRKDDCYYRLIHEGLDVLIGDKAYDICGNKLPPEFISIFTKEKK